MNTCEKLKKLYENRMMTNQIEIDLFRECIETLFDGNLHTKNVEDLMKVLDDSTEVQSLMTDVNNSIVFLIMKDKKIGIEVFSKNVKQTLRYAQQLLNEIADEIFADEECLRILNKTLKKVKIQDKVAIGYLISSIAFDEDYPNEDLAKVFYQNF